jgi:hypothetical protein
MKLGEEMIPVGEPAAIAKVVAASEALLDRDAKPIVRRGQHPKQHGCVRAEFRVEHGLPTACRVGLFAEEGKVYPCYIRFSNGRQQDDRQGDAHGMAIKLMGVPGRKVLDEEANEETHDFVLVDNPVFFLPNAIDYGQFSDATEKSRGKVPSLTNRALGFLPGQLRELGTIILLYFFPRRLGQLTRLIHFASKKPGNPLGTRYWSTTPYEFGPGQAVKYSATPESIVAGPPASSASALSADFLREAMAAVLNVREARFSFAVQFQTDAATMPIEDPTVDWDETKSRFLTVATIAIAPQEFHTPDRMTFGENLSFTPWHALPEHRPLGGINRTRKAVYSALSKLRHKLNNVPMREPTA